MANSTDFVGILNAIIDYNTKTTEELRGKDFEYAYFTMLPIKSIVWRCVSRLDKESPECDSPTITEEALTNTCYPADF